MECQYVATQRGGVALVFEGHRYNKVRDGKDGTVYWRCSRDRQCPGRAVTVNSRVKKANNKHNHPPEASLRNGHGHHHHHHHHNNSSSNHIHGLGLQASTNAFPTRAISTSPPISAHNNNEVSLGGRLPSSQHFSLQDVFDAHQSAAAASAASLPAIVTETLKYLAFASGHPHMAAALASQMASSLTSPSLRGIVDGLPPPITRQQTPFTPEDLDDDDYYSDESESDQPLNMAIRSSNQCLKKLRGLMRNPSIVPEALQAYIVPSCDAHQSEYIANCDRRRAFITGFTGSAGTAVITADDACLWTDGRYWLQAEKQLDSNWKLMKDTQGAVTQSEWLIKVLPTNSRVGVDPMLMPFSQWKTLSTTLEDAGHQLVPVNENLIDLIWDERPAPPTNPIVPLPDSYAGRPWQEKVAEVRKDMEKKKAKALIITALDDIAYLFNLRGSDIDFNPVFFAYCVVTFDNLYLFVDETKLTNATRRHLGLDTAPCVIELRPYKMVREFVKWLVTQETGKIWISKYAAYALVSLIPEKQRIQDANPVALQKIVKNDTEIQGMRQAHIKDAVALCEFFAWLEDAIEAAEDVTEISAAEKLEEFRKGQDDYVGPSFESISASGPNGAVIHYKPSQETNRPLSKEEMYLLDCGAQFLDGTTDVTRTVHFGTPSKYQKECFTRVIKGHIALASVVFPRKTKGYSLDTLARKSLWDVGLDYMHGTGHGVGMYLNVHEGPCYIGYSAHPDDPGLMEGMFLSNEPGFYQDGQFGIRIESIVVVEKAETQHNFQDRGFLKFDTVTLVPIQLKLLDSDLLTEREIEWINSYHETCRAVIGQVLEEQGKKHALKWLMRETQSIG